MEAPEDPSFAEKLHNESLLDLDCNVDDEQSFSFKEEVELEEEEEEEEGDENEDKKPAPTWLFIEFESLKKCMEKNCPYLKICL
jgi:hypothetical protein